MNIVKIKGTKARCVAALRTPAIANVDGEPSWCVLSQQVTACLRLSLGTVIAFFYWCPLNEGCLDTNMPLWFQNLPLNYPKDGGLTPTTRRPPGLRGLT